MTALHNSEEKQEEAERLAKKYGVAIDARDKFEVVTDLRSKGVDAIPSVIAIYQLRYYHNQGNTESKRERAAAAHRLGRNLEQADGVVQRERPVRHLRE